MVGLVTRLITFYVIMAVIGVAVVVLVISKGGSEKAQPAIAGGYAASRGARVSDRCRSRRAAPRCRRRRRRRPRRRGRRSTSSSPGSSSTSPTTRARSAGQLRLSARRFRQGHQITGNVSCVSTASHWRSTRSRSREPRARSSGTLGGLPFSAALKTAPPAPGAAAPRTPSNIQGTFTLSPASTCFGSSFSIHGTGAVATLYSSSGKNLGPLTYSDKTGRGVRRRQVRQGRDRAVDRDRERHPAPERHRDSAPGRHAGAVEGPDGQAGADHPFGPRPGG